MNIKLYLMSLLAIIILAGCTKNLKYTSKQLMPLNHATAGTTQTKDGLTIHFKEFDETYCKHHFNTQNLNVHPIQLSIDNKTEKEWVLLQDNIELELVSPECVANNLQSNFLTSFLLPLPPEMTLSHSVASNKANTKIQKDVTSKAMPPALTIKPHELETVILYTKKRKMKRTKKINLSFIDSYNKDIQLTFEVNRAV